MRLHEAIHRADALCPNTYGLEEKLRWLGEVEGKVCREILHCGGRVPNRFDAESDPMTPLRAEPPYDGLYVLYLQMQIDYFNGETARWSNSSAAFEAAWRDYAAWYNRTHLPAQPKKRYW